MTNKITVHGNGIDLDISVATFKGILAGSSEVPIEIMNVVSQGEISINGLKRTIKEWISTGDRWKDYLIEDEVDEEKTRNFFEQLYQEPFTLKGAVEGVADVVSEAADDLWNLSPRRIWGFIISPFSSSKKEEKSDKDTLLNTLDTLMDRVKQEGEDKKNKDAPQN